MGFTRICWWLLSSFSPSATVRPGMGGCLLLSAFPRCFFYSSLSAGQVWMGAFPKLFDDGCSLQNAGWSVFVHASISTSAFVQGSFWVLYRQAQQRSSWCRFSCSSLLVYIGRRTKLDGAPTRGSKSLLAAARIAQSGYLTSLTERKRPVLRIV